MSKIDRILILDKDLIKDLKKIKKKEGTTVSAICRLAIRKYLKENKE